MNSKRTLLMALAVLALGLFAMPTTLSLFSGQHTFVNNASSFDCRKCHADVYDELTWNQYGGEAPPHTSTPLIECKVCHRTGQLIFMGGEFKISGSPSLNLSTMNGTHAAVTVECIFCHDLVTREINESSSDAHRTFYNSSNQSTLLKGGNEACIGCHTRLRFTGIWIRKGLNITAEIRGTGAWNVSISINQTNATVVSSGS